MTDVWEQVARQPDTLPPGWRRHARAVHLALLQAWLGGAPQGRWLKTDLAEELHAHRSLLEALPQEEWIGIDVARGAAGALQGRSCQADVRRLPFASASFDGVLSTSTLDHFHTELDIHVALAELARVLRVGGSLVVTFDNPRNPLIALRNALPPAIARATGLAPFPVGPTLDDEELRRALVAAGLTVVDERHLLHTPHVVGTRLARWGWWERHVLPAFDRLGSTPLARYTGHFVAAHGVKPGPARPALAPARLRPRPRFLGPATVAEVARLAIRARTDVAARRRRQLADVNALRDHACSTVAFWAARRAGYPPLGDLDEIRTWPTVTKGDLRTVTPDELTAGPVPPSARTMTTSGTSGEPFTVHYDARAAWQQGVAAAYQSMYNRHWPWQRTATTQFIADQRRTPSVDAWRRSRKLLLRPDRPAGELADELAAFRPARLAGHGHLLVEIGEALRGRWRPQAVSTFGETLTPENRDAIEALFGVAPMDTYGTAEAGRIAWQCEARDLYHVNHDVVYVELLDVDGAPVPPGLDGEIVVTTTWNWLMPLLRYRCQDTAAWAARPCRCGHRAPAFTHVTGRTPHWIVAADGRRIAPQRLWLTVHSPALDARRYRVVQSRSGDVTIEVVPGPRYRDEDMQRMVDGYRAILGQGIGIRVELRDHLELDASGKFEQFRSERVVPASGGRN